MKFKIRDIVIVSGCLLLIIVFTIFSINRKNDYKIENEKIENIISNVQVKTYSSTPEVNHIVLYEGREIKVKSGRQVLKDMDLTDENKEKYNITYYSYKNDKKKEVNGNFSEETYEGVAIVQNVDKIAISEDYDLMPRKAKTLKELPSEMKLKLDYTDITIQEVDLNGDEKNEYILIYEIEDDDVAKSSIELYGSDYQKIATLISLDDGVVEGDDDVFLSEDDIEYVDIDKDNVLEIIIEEPTYEGNVINIYKYTGNRLDGNINIKATLKP